MKRTYKISIVSLLLSALFVGVAVFHAFAATGAPKILSYQGRLLDASGNLLGGSGTAYCFRFSLYNASSGGSQVWPVATASIMTATVANGVFNIGVGDTSAGGDALTYNFQDSDTTYLNVQVAKKVDTLCTGGSEVFETLNPRTRVVASGYAINSNMVGGFSAGMNASGTMIPVIASDTLTLAGVNPQINAVGTNTLTLQGGAGTGAIQFFSANNYINSSTFRMAGAISANALQMALAPTQAINISLAALGPTAIQFGAASGTYIGINTSGTYNGDYLEFENNSATVLNVASSGRLTIGTSTNIGSALFAVATSTNIFTILNNGNIGVGTSTSLAATSTFIVQSVGTNSPFMIASSSGAMMDYIDAGGNFYINPAGSTTSTPKIFGFSPAFTTGQMGQLQFGDTNNTIQNGYSGRMQLSSYWGMEIHGSRQTTSASYVAGGTTDPALSVYGSATTSSPVFQLLNYAGTSTFMTVSGIGNVGIGTSTPGNQLTVAAAAVPTADQVTISNLGYPINTSGTNNLQLTYVGGNATSIESGGERINLTPGTGAGSMWNGFRVVAASTTTSTVQMNAIKIDSIGAGGAGIERGIFIDTGWDTALAAAGVPGQRASSSLIRLGQMLTGGNVLGTFLSVNQTTSTGADFLNFQLSSSSIFKIASSGNVVMGNSSTPFTATTTLTICPLRTATTTCTFSTTATTGTVLWVGSTNNATSGNSIIAKGKVVGSTNDFGEYINVVGSDTDYSAGDILSVASSGANLFQKSRSPYDPQLAGAITVTAAFLGGGDDGNGSNVIALAGRIPVKVTGANGPIAIGDYITSSNIPGYGMRATQPGRVVGVAMQSFSGTDANATGTVLMFVNPGWAPGTLAGASSSAVSSLSIDGPLQQFFGIVASIGNTVQTFIRASVIAVENLFVKKAAILPEGSVTVPSGPDQMSGSATLAAHATEVFIPNQQVSSSSKIFVTPTTMTDVPLSVIARQDGSGFTVGVASGQPNDISFDWLVIQSYHVGGADQFWSQGGAAASGASVVTPIDSTSTSGADPADGSSGTVASTTSPSDGSPTEDASPPAGVTSTDDAAGDAAQ